MRTVVAFDEPQGFLRIDDGLDGLLRSKIQLHRDEAGYMFAGAEPEMLDGADVFTAAR